jgi:hypothetical protein
LPPYCLAVRIARVKEFVIATGAGIVAVNITGAVRGVATAGVVAGGVVTLGAGIVAVNITGAVRNVVKTTGRITVHHFFITSKN